MKNYKIHIDEDLDIKTKKILNDYWLIQNDNFLHKPTEITQMHDITQGELTKLVKKHSNCEINFGNCLECNEKMKITITSKHLYKYYTDNKSDRCVECQRELRRKIEQQQNDRLEEIRKEKLLKFDEAIIEKRWMELSKNELSLLYELICNKTKSKIFKNVFEGDYSNKSMWRDVFKFERLGLINLIKKGGYVNEFEFDERINEVIKNLVLKKMDFDRYSDSSVSNILGFSLTRKEYKKNDRDPDYGGTFTLPEDIILKANTKYIYGGWIQTDGSINLRFTPIANLPRNNVTQENLENEPQLIGDIVKNMFNEIRDDTRVLPTFDQAFGTLDSNFYENNNEDDDWDVSF